MYWQPHQHLGTYKPLMRFVVDQFAFSRILDFLLILDSDGRILKTVKAITPEISGNGTEQRVQTDGADDEQAPQGAGSA